MSECIWINGPDPHESGPLRLIWPARVESLQFHTLNFRAVLDLDIYVLGLKKKFDITILLEDLSPYAMNSIYDKNFRLILEEVV